MERDNRSSNRDRTRAGQTDERNEHDRSAAPRGARRGPARDEDPRDGMSPPSRSGAPGGAGKPGRPGSPSDPGGRRGGNGGGGGFIRSPLTASGAPGDDGDEYGPRSRPGNAAPGRGGRPNDTPDRSSRAPIPATGRQRGPDGDGYGTAERSGTGGRRSMASMARDASRSMSRQLGAALSRTGRSIRDAGAPPVRIATPPPTRGGTPPSSRRVAVPAEIAEKLASQSHRRSRVRMVAAKWRRGRIPPNPLLVIGGMLLGISLAFITVFAGGAGFLYAYNYYQYHTADIQAIANLRNQSSSTIYDRNGFPLYTVHNDQGFQIYVPLSQISQKVQWATIDTEDRTFYSNVGIDFQATLRAVTVDLKAGGSAQGASTITQQIVKNIVLHDSTKAIQRKLNEAILAYGVTQQYTKAQILEMYLDTIPYGDQNQGIEAAARNFFGLEPKDVNGQYELANQQLSWAQAAILAGLPNAPTLYLPVQFSCVKAPCQQSQWDNPFVPGHECDENYFISSFGPDWYLVRGHEWLVYCRASAVLNNLAHNGMPASAGTFTQADVQPALDEVQNILINQQIYHWAGQSNGSATNEGIKRAPHFVDYVVQQLANLWGISDLETGGYKIYTTLDYNLEKFAEENIQHYVEHSYTETFYPTPYAQNPFAPLSDPSNANAHNAALVAIDQYTGDILAMVGSMDYNSKDPHVLGSNNITISTHRSMGSSTKPLVYATAFQMGWNPGVMLQDTPICFPDSIVQAGQTPVVDKFAPACKGWYVPHDYEENNASGTFPLRRHLDDSLNIGATETMSFVGDGPSTSSAFLAMAQRLGVTTLTAGAMGPTTVLGTQDISLLQLTSAYGTFANLGKRAPERSILRIEKNDGTVLYPTRDTPNMPQTYQAISPQAAYMITNVLTDNFARYPAFKLHNPLHLDELPNLAIAGKTGTSSGDTGPLDIVTMGYSPYLTLGVWIGNTDGNDPLTPGVIGVTGAGYIFHDVMLWAAQHYNWPTDAQFQVPPGLARGQFNCNTGLAPYKGQQPSDLVCRFNPYAKGSMDPYDPDKPVTGGLM